jgi:hypothetical protein
MNVSVSQRPIGTSANKAFPARAPTIGTDHVGGDGSFVDKYQASGVKHSRIQPRRLRATSARFRSAARRLF